MDRKPSRTACSANRGHRSFALLRSHARDSNERLAELALAVVEDVNVADRVLASATRIRAVGDEHR